MARWTGIVIALPSSQPDGMVSRLPTYLHPIAGRPLAWHAAASFADASNPPGRVLVISEGDLTAELFEDIPLTVETVIVPAGEERARTLVHPLGDGDESIVLHASAIASGRALDTLLDRDTGAWLAGGQDLAALVRSDADHLSRMLRLPDPFEVPNGAVAMADRVETAYEDPVVTDRVLLAATIERVRRRLVGTLMAGGVSFLLPDTVLVDVDVRVGRDSIVYPGVVLEGATTVGEETVIGPACRIIDSWVGSGVELRGWNYISHTSIRNRAILEPYVRRGFD